MTTKQHVQTSLQFTKESGDSEAGAGAGDSLATLPQVIDVDSQVFQLEHELEHSDADRRG